MDILHTAEAQAHKLTDNNRMNAPPLGDNRCTTIKICGLTRTEDVQALAQAGVHAAGFVLYPASPRAITLAQAQQLAKQLPPFITPVLLFVNADRHAVQAAIKAMPRAVLQFHGDETPAFCESFHHAYIRAARIPQDIPQQNTTDNTADAIKAWDLLQFSADHPNAQAILLDAHVPGYGGGGKVFDWQRIQQYIDKPLILGGGLSADNVAAGIVALRPFTPHLSVDVSSGVEQHNKQGIQQKGIKDAQRIRRFVQAVRHADSTTGTQAQ